MEEIKSEKEKKEEKIVEANIINENEPIDEEQSNNNSNEESKNIEDVKCFINSNDETIDEKNVKNNNSGEFKSCSFKLATAIYCCYMFYFNWWIIDIWNYFDIKWRYIT